jgi:hypothetical protein
MEIRLKGTNVSHEIVVKDTNVLIEFDATEREWIKDENGKAIRSINDISDEALNMFTTVTEDLIYYRQKEYDSSNLIIQLFDKLSEGRKDMLLDQLRADYEKG